MSSTVPAGAQCPLSSYLVDITVAEEVPHRVTNNSTLLHCTVLYYNVLSWTVLFAFGLI